MQTTITIEGANINLNGINLKEILAEVYKQGKLDNTTESQSEKVTFIALSKELEEKQGRTISVRTLTQKAKDANVKVFRFDGNKLALYRKDIKHFLNY